MKAMVMTQAGDPSVLEPRDLPLPELPPDSIRVRLGAAGINPVDAKLRSSGTFFPERLPAILGCDGAGVVDAVGHEVARFQPGDAVYFCYGGIGAHPGNYAEYQTLPARYAARAPSNLDFTEAAALPLALITAWEALADRAAIHPGKRVLIHGGAGGVGHLAIQLALLWGGSVCSTVGSPENAAFVRELGAYPIDYREEDFVRAVQYWSAGAGVDVALDTQGGEVLERTVEAMAEHGDLVTILQPPAALDWAPWRRRNLRLGLEFMLTPMLGGNEAGLAHQTRLLELGARLVEAQRLRVQVSDVLELEAAAEAHRRIASGHTQGKRVLRIP